MVRRLATRSGLVESSAFSRFTGEPRALAWLWKKPASLGSEAKVDAFWVR